MARRPGCPGFCCRRRLVRAGLLPTPLYYRLVRVIGGHCPCSDTAGFLPRSAVTISVSFWRAGYRFLACWVPRGGGRHAPPRLQAALYCGCWLLAAACLCFAGVRSSTRVKTLLASADADHGDTRGCHFLLGGVALGRAAPPLCARGNPRSALSDRPAAALRCRSLLGGAVLAARASVTPQLF
jgi:hypothetical protein